MKNQDCPTCGCKEKELIARGMVASAEVGEIPSVIFHALPLDMDFPKPMNKELHLSVRVDEQGNRTVEEI